MVVPTFCCFLTDYRPPSNETFGVCLGKAIADGGCDLIGEQPDDDDGTVNMFETETLHVVCATNGSSSTTASLSKGQLEEESTALNYTGETGRYRSPYSNGRYWKSDGLAVEDTGLIRCHDRVLFLNVTGSVTIKNHIR